jgi:hypothetical protein
LTLSDTGRPAGYSVHCSLKDAPCDVKSLWYCNSRCATDSDMSLPMSRAHSSATLAASHTRNAAALAQCTRRWSMSKIHTGWPTRSSAR